jgi:hypothetical protein
VRKNKRVDKQRCDGDSATISKELAEQDQTAYINWIRMSVDKFKELLQMVGPKTQ